MNTRKYIRKITFYILNQIIGFHRTPANGAVVGCHPKEIFFAYDTPDDYEPLVEAGRMLLRAGFTVSSQSMRAYVLIGYPNDTFEKAEARLMEAIRAGFMPMAMLYRDKKGNRDME